MWGLLLGLDEWRNFVKGQAAQCCVSDAWRNCLDVNLAQRYLASGLTSFQACSYEACQRDISAALRVARIAGDPVVGINSLFVKF